MVVSVLSLTWHHADGELRRRQVDVRHHHAGAIPGQLLTDCPPDDTAATCNTLPVTTVY